MVMGAVTSRWSCFNRAFRREVAIAPRKLVFHWLSWCFPLLLFILIGSIFSEGSMQELPVAVVDNDHSALSRELIRKLDAGSHAQLTQWPGGLAQARQNLSNAQDYGVLYIPPNFEADVLDGRQPQVTFYYNALFYASGLYSTQDFSGLMTELNSSYRSVVAARTGKIVPSLPNVSLSYDSLFNASSSFIYYQLFAATIHLVQLFVVTSMIYVLSRSKPLIYSRHFISSLLGKLAFYTLIYTTLLIAEMALLVWVFDARVVGNPLYMVCVSFFYVIAAQSLGLLLYTFTRSSITAYTMMAMMVSIALSFSGLAVPELSMPLFAQIISQIEPLTHALYAMFDIFLRHVPSRPIFGVCALLCVYPLVAGLLVRKRLAARLYQQESVL